MIRHVVYCSWLIRLPLIALGLYGAVIADNGVSEPMPPNVVIILVDDMGYADIGLFGAEHDITPNLNRLATQGLRFTNFYVAQPICTASRAALLTGAYPNRIGLYGAVFPKSKIGLNADEATLAEILRSRGYSTGIFGKWHLGDAEPFLPLQHGFDEFFGIPYSNDMNPRNPYYTAYIGHPAPPLPLIAGNRQIAVIGDQSLLTQRITEQAVSFIERHHNHPFFLYLPHPMPHVPLAVSPSFEGKTGRGLYADTVAEIDWSVGQIMDALDRLKIADNTIVMFLSDNGPWLVFGDHAGSANPLREGKQTVWEGGVRVPFMIRWPGRVPPGKVEDEPAMNIDLLPTLAGWTGAKLPEHKIDGLDIGPLLTGQPGAINPHEAYFFYYGSANPNELRAVRSGRWKLVFAHTYPSVQGHPLPRGGEKGTAVSRPTPLVLYDLVADPGEEHDIASTHPEIVERLSRLADEMRHDLGDSLTGVAATGARKPGQIQ